MVFWKDMRQDISITLTKTSFTFLWKKNLQSYDRSYAINILSVYAFIKNSFFIDIILMFYANVVVALSLLIEGYYTLINKTF